MSKLKKIALVYLSLSCFCLVAIVAVYMIPQTEMSKKNLQESCRILKEEGVYKRALVDMMFFDLDNPTNETMLAKAAYYSSNRALESALMNYGTMNYIGGGNDTSMYGRYWHGYLLLLKPAMLVMDYNQIRIANYLIIGILMFAVCLLLYNKTDTWVAFAFLVSLFAVECYIVPMSLQLSTMFYVTLGSSLFLLLYNDWLIKRQLMECCFFIIGGLTSYCDLLTTPIMSLGFPLLILILLGKKDTSYKAIGLLSFSWLLGYASIWATKWVLVSVLTDYNMIADALSQVLLRLGWDSGITDLASTERQANVLFERVVLVFNNLSSNPVLLSILIIVGIGVFIFTVLPKKTNAYKINFVYLLVAAIPIVWYILLGNHTGIHWRFAHRSLAVTILSVLLFVYKTVDWQNIGSLLKKENEFKR